MRALVFPALLAAAAAAALAQTPASTFSWKTVQPELTQTLGDGGTVSFNAIGIGIASDANVTLTYRPAIPTLAVTLVSADLTGSTDFSINGLPDLSGASGPLILNRNTTALGFNVRFKPTTSRTVTGKITLNFTEADTATAPAFRGNRTAAFTLNLTGATPEFGTTYAVQPNGNSALLRQGEAIRLPDTPFLETASVSITITNRGTAPGTVSAVTLKGPANFALAGVPLPPIVVEAGKSISFSVRFTPDQFEPAAASVQIDFLNGTSLGFSVSGIGLGAEYLYETINGRTAANLEPNGTVTLPQAVVNGDKTLATIRVTNVGNADSRINAISVTGAGFAVQESPFLPYLAAAGTSFTVVVSFTPSTPGKFTGRLRVGLDNFNLEATTLGSNVTFSYSAGGDASALLNAGTIVFAPTAVGASSTATFVARNEGTASSLVNSISVTGTGTVFALGSLPALPMRLEPGGSITVTLIFTPVTVGANTGTLRVDTNTFTLSGSSNPPAALPEYSFQGGTGNVDPQQQPAIGLSLNAGYPLALSGVLTLTFTSDVFANDPAVQFASGGRTVPFTIPANTRQAIFPNSATQMRIQTGTVAGTITLTPSFTTTAGAIDLTPTVPPALSLRIPQAAPQLLNAVLSARTANSFTLLVTGYATGRSITQMDFTLTPKAGENVATTKITLNVDSTFSSWYQSTASQAFGSLFTATIPFTLAGDISKDIKDLIETITSVSVTLTNRQGVSTARTVNIP